MTDVTYHNFRVRYLATRPDSPSAVKDSVNPDLWVCEDIVPAVSEAAAFQQVIARGDIPVRARLVRHLARHIASDYKLKLMMAIMFAVQSGASVGAAMEQTIEAESWPLRAQLDPALRLLRSGSTFSEAISILGMYDETTLAILNAGEHTGTMKQSLATALNHLQRKGTADALMKSAVGMILVDVFMAMTSAMTAVFGLLPQAEKQGLQTKDPLALARWQDAIQIGYWSNWVLLVGAAIALLFAVVAWAGYEYGAPATRARVEQFLRRLPFLGDALLHDAIAVSTNIAGHLLKGGVLFASAAEITARTIRLPAVRDYWTKVLVLTLEGTPVSAALSRSPLTSAEQRVVAAHTSSAQLAEAFSQISDYRQGQAGKSNKMFVVAGLVGSFLYSGLGIVSTLYVNYIQITSIMSGSQ